MKMALSGGRAAVCWALLFIFLSGQRSQAEEHFTIGSEAGEEAWSGNINIYSGNKHMLDKAFAGDGTANQPELGVTVDFKKARPSGWPVNFLVGYFISKKSNTINTMTTTSIPVQLNGEDRTEELRVGFRKLWDPNSFIHPFIGAGLAHLRLRTRVDVTSPYGNLGSFEVSGSATGVWGDIGITLIPTPHLNLSFMASTSTGRASVETEDVDLGGDHFLGSIGYNW